MVFRGTPSSGCKPCRDAKKRCTLERPACSRCVKSRKECYGYRDVSELLFIRAAGKQPEIPARQRHLLPKTEPLEGHAGPSSSNDIIRRETDDGSVVSSRGSLDDEQPQPTLRERSLSVDKDDLAISSFFTQFGSTEPGFWTLLRDSMQILQSDPCLNVAIRACGMATFAGVRKADKGLLYARSKYVDALRLVNTQLRDPQQCKTDETLLAVYLLGLYEILTSHNVETFRSWHSHMDGLTQLVQLRGKAQLESGFGRSLFREVQTQILTRHIWDETEPPSFLRQWDSEQSDFPFIFPDKFSSGNIVTLCLDVASIRARIKAGSIPTIDDVREVDRVADDLASWIAEASNESVFWKFTSTPRQDATSTWNVSVHNYTCHMACNAWLTLRCTRSVLIEAQDRLHNVLEIDDHEGSLHRQRLIRQLTDDICMGVPFVLGPNSTGNTFSARNVIWPLYVAGQAIIRGSVTQSVSQSGNATGTQPQLTADLEQLDWIIDKLKFISEEYGLRWAYALSTMLRSELAEVIVIEQS